MMKKFIWRKKDALSFIDKGSEVRLMLVDGDQYWGIFIGWAGAKVLLQSLNRQKFVEVNPIFIESFYEAVV